MMMIVIVVSPPLPLCRHKDQRDGKVKISGIEYCGDSNSDGGCHRHLVKMEMMVNAEAFDMQRAVTDRFYALAPMVG